ncbi:MAG: dynamin family protein [Saprospiraceae bacterium]|nr:dynamin family protein [Saprospiraceae bacterium]MCB9344056.1 dynamin family protein [Lewinellaceae bacterium]
MIINQRTLALRAQCEDIVKDLQQLSQEIGHKELAATVGELRNRMTEPFMFVIVGEVKAGKSSFVNALLDAGKEICAVAPQPMTDTIQQILYGENEETITVNPYLKKIFLPVDILKEIAIVDTPGTNSIVERHQEITENFIPASDLVIFVFEAKNPYRQSAWDFFDFINKEWHKKIIFVLQQKDLMNEEDLSVNTKGLYDYAVKKGLAEPVIFSVSAKDEIEGRFDRSNFSAIRDHIRTHVTGGRGASLKLKNNVDTTRQILERVKTDLDTRQKQFELDTEFRNDIHQTLDNQEKKSNHHVSLLIENLLNGYDRITKQTGRELSDGLSFPAMLKRSFMGIFSKQASVGEWLDGLAKKLETQLNAELRNKLNDGVVDLADSVQQMAKMIDLKIKSSNSVVKGDAYIFETISEKRAITLKELQEAFSRFMSRSENFADARLFPENANVSPNIAAGSGAALVGMILAAATNVAVLDITGGVLTGIGILFAGITAGVQKRKIVKGYQDEIAAGKTQMQEVLESKLRGYVRTIKGRINENFDELDALLENEKSQISDFKERWEKITTRLNELDKSLD